MNTFHVGQRVVCIARGDWPRARAEGLRVPVRGQVYVIRDVYVDPNYDEVGVRLVEVVNPRDMLFNGEPWETGWLADEFRPVRETDISIFTAMLTRVPEEVS